MSKILLTTLIILSSVSYTPAFAASAEGRVKMTVVRTDVQPADINIVKIQSSVAAISVNAYTVEIVY